MELEDRYLKLIHLLVYDKRTKSSGMICSLDINGLIGGFGISYRVILGANIYRDIFVEDFEKGNVVFLIPYGVGYMEKELAEMGVRHKEIIKEFFANSFREDMIMEISEDERQTQIKEWDKCTKSLYYWNKVIEKRKTYK